jgi:glycosyltransferase involved in cell wall biosynthesis
VRVAFLSVSDQLGGSEVALLGMISGLRRLRPDWRVQLLLPGRGPLLDRADAAGADCVVLPMPRSLRGLGEFAASDTRRPVAARLAFGARLVPVATTLPGYLRRLRRALAALAPAILHTNGIKAHVIGARALGRRALVWHVHDYMGERGLSRTLLRAHQGPVSAILTNSRSVAEDVRRALNPSAPVHVLHNAVDLEAFRPDGPAEDLDARAGWPPPSAPVVRVGLVATFAKWKGHEVFLRALAAMPPELPVRGYIIGEPVYDTVGSEHSLEELRALASRLGAAGRVGFTGFLRAAPAMRALDVVVHASTAREPFGLVIAEAMACGRAVVTSGCGGAGELVQPDVDAVTHPPGDAAALSQAIARLVTDRALREELGVRARAAACERFDPDRVASTLVGLYETLAASVPSISTTHTLSR